MATAMATLWARIQSAVNSASGAATSTASAATTQQQQPPAAVQQPNAANGSAVQDGDAENQIGNLIALFAGQMCNFSRLKGVHECFVQRTNVHDKAEI